MERKWTNLIIRNLRLLGIVDNVKKNHEFDLSESSIASLQHKTKAFEFIIYYLCSLHDPDSSPFSRCWPVYDSIQSKEFRQLAYKWLLQLKEQGFLGTSVVLRKSMLEEVKGERYLELLLALSSLVLREWLEKQQPLSSRMS